MDFEQAAALRAKARQILEHNATAGVPAPDFGADKLWLNTTRSLSLRGDLAGRLVLLDFWTYSCINCLHVLPDLARLEEHYRGEAFVVVGCHSAKSSAERELENVRCAVLRERVEHPVVVDREFDIWRRFGVRAWPTLMLIAPDGRILGQVSGEGQGAVLDVLVEQALELYGALAGALDPRPLPLRLERTREIARELRFPGKVLADAGAQRLYIADSGHHRIVVTDLDGNFVRAIGSGEPWLADGAGEVASFHGPRGLALLDGALLVADTLNHALRRIDLATGQVETLAGNGHLGYERARTLHAPNAQLNSPWDVRVAGERVLIAMAGAHQIWSYDPAGQTLAPLAGDGAELKRDGAFELAAFAQPSGLAVLEGSVFVADSESSSIRALDLETRRVTTLAGAGDDPRNLFLAGDEDGCGAGRRFQHPLGIELDAALGPERALLYVADSYNHKLKLVDPESGSVTTYAGGAAGFEDGDAGLARFHEPQGLSIAGRRLYVADTNNHAIRVVDLEQHEVRTLALRGVPLPPAALRDVATAEWDAGPLPRLASTVEHPLVRRHLAVGDAVLELRLGLAPGEHLAPLAPAQYRVLREAGLVAARAVAGPIEAATLSIPLGVAGPGLLRAQALYYVCDARGACHVRSHEWRVDIEEHERAGERLVLEAPAAG